MQPNPADNRHVRRYGTETTWEESPGVVRVGLAPGIVVRGGVDRDSNGRMTGREIGTVPEFHPFIALRRGPGEQYRDGDPDGGYWLSFYAAGGTKHTVVAWPGELVEDFFQPQFFAAESEVVEQVRDNMRANEDALMEYAGLTRFPVGERFALVGRGRSKQDWIDGLTIKVEGEVAWRPQATIYLNWTEKIRDDDSEKWVMVIDRRVGVEVLDAQKWDGLMLSTACSKELVAEAMRRCLPILVMDPREGEPGLVRAGWVRVAHQGSVSGTALNLLGIGPVGGLRRPKTLLVCGLDGDAELKPAHECKSEQEYVQPLAYYNIATQCAAQCQYLSDLGVTVIQRGFPGTPFMSAVQALSEWKAVVAMRIARRKAMAKREGGLVVPPVKKLVAP